MESELCGQSYLLRAVCSGLGEGGPPTCPEMAAKVGQLEGTKNHLFKQVCSNTHFSIMSQEDGEAPVQVQETAVAAGEEGEVSAAEKEGEKEKKKRAGAPAVVGPHAPN